MTAAKDAPPTPAQSELIEAWATTMFELLEERALSIGLLDIGLEVDGWNVDVELLFTSNPDMGLTIDARSGAAQVCELLGDDEERWIDDARVEELDVLGAHDVDAPREVALRVLQALLDARRPLLTRD